MKGSSHNIKDLSIGKLYSKSDVLNLDVKSLNNRGIDYLKYEDQSKIFFFEKVSNNLYILFNIISHTTFESILS